MKIITCEKRSPIPSGGAVFSRPQSQRDCVIQARVARNELPWVGGRIPLNPEWVPAVTLDESLEGERARRTAFPSPPLKERAKVRRPFSHTRPSVAVSQAVSSFFARRISEGP